MVFPVRTRGVRRKGVPLLLYDENAVVQWPVHWTSDLSGWFKP